VCFYGHVLQDFLLLSGQLFSIDLEVEVLVNLLHLAQIEAVLDGLVLGKSTLLSSWHLRVVTVMVVDLGPTVVINWYRHKSSILLSDMSKMMKESGMIPAFWNANPWTRVFGNPSRM
jgi:hypothetical protein